MHKPKGITAGQSTAKIKHSEVVVEVPPDRVVTHTVYTDKQDQMYELLEGVKSGVKVGEPGTNPQFGTYRDRDLKWSATKRAVLKALYELGADCAPNAVDTVTVSKYAGLRDKQVRHHCYHAASDPDSEFQVDGKGIRRGKLGFNPNDIQGGYVVLLHMGDRGYSYYLTEKGYRVGKEFSEGNI